jgi:hypothetical protein
MADETEVNLTKNYIIVDIFKKEYNIVECLCFRCILD